MLVWVFLPMNSGNSSIGWETVRLFSSSLWEWRHRWRGSSSAVWGTYGAQQPLRRRPACPFECSRRRRRRSHRYVFFLSHGFWMSHVVWDGYNVLIRFTNPDFLIGLSLLLFPSSGKNIRVGIIESVQKNFNITPVKWYVFLPCPFPAGF